MSEVKLVQGDKMVVVSLTPKGKIVVEREGYVMPVERTRDINKVVDQYKKYGWELAHDEAQVPTYIQEDVDKYIKLHAKKSEVEKELKELKENIKRYMSNADIDSIKGTNGKQVALQRSTATNSTPLYSNYEVDDILPLIGSNTLKEVTELRVNSDKLESLVKLSNLPKEKKDLILSKRIVKESSRFVVKK